MYSKDENKQEPVICGYTYDEYLKMIKGFHGHVAPGVVIGGFMVDLALRNLPDGEMFDVVCETGACLPDAVQMLTPCTVGNGWLKIINLGRFALAFYEKYDGNGIRIYTDAAQLESWSELKKWFFKLKPKKEQDTNLLMEQIRDAGTSIFGTQSVSLDPEFIKKQHRDAFAVCSICGEGYPLEDGSSCLGCQGEAPYQSAVPSEPSLSLKTVPLKATPVEDAVGRHALHDMTRIIPGKEKGPAFKHNQQIKTGDICRLQKLGRQYVYVTEDNPEHSDWIHEDEAAKSFAGAMTGEGVTNTENPSEGKAELYADRDGLLMVDRQLLEAFNMIPEVTCASRHGYTVVKKGDKLGGTRAIPLFLSREDFDKSMSILNAGSLFRVLPLRKANVGILVTGSEVFRGLVEDRFIPIISKKVEAYDCRVIVTRTVPDDREEICKDVKQMSDAGVDLLVTTAGLSVDPDDVTRQGLIDAGAIDLLYGAPILPGNMTLMARIGNVQIIGVPACGLYHQTTSFDLLLPRLLAGVSITRKDMTALAYGGLCLGCDKCIYPKCSFGK